MAIRFISDEEIKNAQIQGNLPTRPTQKSLYPENTLSSEEVKAAFDKLPRLIAAYYTELVASIIGVNDGELNADSLATYIRTGIREGHTLKDLFFDIINSNLLSSEKLPAITSADNNKVLTAQNGKWIAAYLDKDDALPYILTGSSGTLGDTALYQKIQNEEITLFWLADDEALIRMHPAGKEADTTLLFAGEITNMAGEHNVSDSSVAIAKLDNHRSQCKRALCLRNCDKARLHR